ncbi:transposase DNA-binding-containing protein [Labrys portucalensis]|uniref:Transposase DNA-binding-containing protein n=1 Tax=Labrys neptuniae TaxID=376174 RepID=A0ABV6ZSA1_9HYPH
MEAFIDARLGRRFCDLLRRLSEGMGESIPFACQDWTNTKLPTGPSQTRGSRKAIFSMDISRQHAAAIMRAKVQSCFCRTQPSSPSSVETRTRSASPKA